MFWSKTRPPVKAPFTYRFENDGDLDISLNGEEYGIDSPYDRDRKRKTKKRRSFWRRRR